MAKTDFMTRERQGRPSDRNSQASDANDAVNLEDGLGDVEADCSDCQHDALLRILVASLAAAC